MRILLLIINFCLAQMVVAADVYRTVDEDGNVIYSDIPAADSEKIRVDEIQTIAPGEVPKFEYTPPPKEVAAYTKLEIVSPANDSIIQSDEGKLTISAIVEPGLNRAAGHYLVLYLNGAEAASGTSSQFMLDNVERGTYTANIAVMDQSGTQVMSSPSVAFTLYQHSALHPGSAVGNPPKPP